MCCGVHWMQCFARWRCSDCCWPSEFAMLLLNARWRRSAEFSSRLCRIDKVSNSLRFVINKVLLTCCSGDRRQYYRLRQWLNATRPMQKYCLISSSILLDEVILVRQYWVRLYSLQSHDLWSHYPINIWNTTKQAVIIYHWTFVCLFICWVPDSVELLFRHFLGLVRL